MKNLNQVRKIGLGVSLVTLLIMVAIWLYVARELPQTGNFPLHWGIHGEPDRFGSRSEALWSFAILPGAVMVTTLIFAFARKFDPFGAGLERSRSLFLVVWVGVVVQLLLVQIGVASLLLRAGQDQDIGSTGFVRAMIVEASFLMILIGNYLPKSRQSFILGVRTPWTLTSAESWNKTHILVGRLLIVSGIAGAIGALTQNGIWTFLPLVITNVATVLVGIIYSFLVWRKATDRQLGPHYEA